MVRLTSVREGCKVAVLLAGIASAVSARAAVEDERRRLDDHVYFVESLDKGWEPLLADLDRTLAAADEEGAERRRTLQPIADKARESYAKKKLKEGEAGEPRALQLYEALATSAADEGRRPEFHERSAQILMDQAVRAEKRDKDDAKALDLAKRALVHSPDKGPQFDRAIDVIGRLGLKVGLASKAEDRFDDALQQFQSTVAALKAAKAPDSAPSVVDARKEIDWINENTGPLRVQWLGDQQVLEKVSGPKTTFYGAGTIRLAPAAGGREPPALSADGTVRRVRKGQYAVTVSGAGGKDTYAASVEVKPAGGDVTLPVALPAGMVLVPAAGEDDAFLIDRTELSVGEAKRLGIDRPGDPQAAAAGISYDEAKRAAAAAGKKLPTVAQWTHAAFGSPMAATPRYPWGDAPAEPGIHFVANVDRAQDVESCPAGRSKTGCFNMAGNVWEWIEHRGGGWLIGGSWKNDKLDMNPLLPDGGSWHADFLRDPLPTKDTYERFTNKADESKYYKYKATENTLPLAGMRCVVPLGKPRR